MKVLISGGSRGIGRALVESFTQNGDSVAFIYKNSHDEARALADATGAIAICADVSDASSAKLATEKAISALGGIDILVNNAGISQIKLFTDITDDDWANMINTNLSSAFYLTRSALPSMISQKSGRIINIGSMWGKVGASCEVAYSASKAGLRGLTLALAKELAPSGITVNCVEPGVIDTDMNAKLGADTIASLVEETPIGRLGTPEDIARAVLFLASEHSSFITGQILGVDGGIV